MLETMEQQSVSVAKSGITTVLPARTSVIAAANPKEGRYDKSKTLVKNLNLSAPLLSRFDLVFLLLHEQDINFDSILSEHVMMLHTGSGVQNVRSNKNEYIKNRIKTDANQSLLKNKLMRSIGSVNVIPQSSLRKYISYAKQFVKPKLSKKSADILKEFYLDLRKMGADTVEDVPICARQLEALVRLTEARAKMDLRVETTEDDARDIIELFQSTIVSMSFDMPNIVPRSGGKAGKNCETILRKLVEREIRMNEDKVTFTKNELKNIATEGGIPAAEFQKALYKLNLEGALLQRGGDLYKYVT